ncbi:SLOG family protein [Streptomyces sp. NPDC002730]|uniref:SLOG family protein n=1 Tax=Streptomyces sp. NPDC002730 TaxID=3364662 RepID=UPI0036900F18
MELPHGLSIAHRGGHRGTGLIRLLVTGSRTWTDPDLIQGVIGEVLWLRRLRPRDLLLIHGACPRGADAMADQFARDIGMSVRRHSADWGTYGKRAGFLRNAEMVRAGADLCFAFIRGGSAGASMTADLAIKAGIPTEVFKQGD